MTVRSLIDRHLADFSASDTRVARLILEKYPVSALGGIEDIARQSSVSAPTVTRFIKRLGVPLIALTGNPASTIARLASISIDVSVAEEACPLGLAPTSSSTATLAMGDALAITLLEARGFTAEDFARAHPGGRLGRRLLLISDVMHTGAAIPQVTENVRLSEALVEMTKKGLGMTSVVDADRHIVGIFTDCDLRRALDREINVHTSLISAIRSSS